MSFKTKRNNLEAILESSREFKLLDISSEVKTPSNLEEQKTISPHDEL